MDYFIKKYKKIKTDETCRIGIVFNADYKNKIGVFSYIVELVLCTPELLLVFEHALDCEFCILLVHASTRLYRSLAHSDFTLWLGCPVKLSPRQSAFGWSGWNRP